MRRYKITPANILEASLSVQDFGGNFIFVNKFYVLYAKKPDNNKALHTKNYIVIVFICLYFIVNFITVKFYMNM